MSGVEITTRDVYDQVAALSSQLAKISGHLESVDTRLESGHARMTDHETRIRAIEQSPDVPAALEARVAALEKLAWKLIGAFAAVNAGAVLVEWFLWAHK